MASSTAHQDCLSLNDLHKVYNELYDARTRWYNIGLQLGLSTSDLDAISIQHRGNPDDCLREVLSSWLRSQVNPKPSWTMLAVAVRSPLVGFEKMSEDIKKKFKLSVNFKRQEQAPEQSVPSNTTSSLTLPAVFKIVFPLASEWKNIGLFLGIDDSTLDKIACDHTKVNDCLREMLSVWLKRVDPQPSWERLAEEVENFDQRVAEKIHQTYCT